MNFVWIHAAFSTIWMVFLERSPWPTLTPAVSLEAIFSSTFVLIGRTARRPSSRQIPITTSTHRKLNYAPTPN